MHDTSITCKTLRDQGYAMYAFVTVTRPTRNFVRQDTTFHIRHDHLPLLCPLWDCLQAGFGHVKTMETGKVSVWCLEYVKSFLASVKFHLRLLRTGGRPSITLTTPLTAKVDVKDVPDHWASSPFPWRISLCVLRQKGPFRISWCACRVSN